MCISTVPTKKIPIVFEDYSCCCLFGNTVYDDSLMMSLALKMFLIRLVTIMMLLVMLPMMIMMFLMMLIIMIMMIMIIPLVIW